MCLAVQTDDSVENKPDILPENPKRSKDPQTVHNQAENDEEENNDHSWCDDLDDPTWNPEKIDSYYQQIKDKDDTSKTHDNPR